jgi:hypothetical protein
LELNIFVPKPEISADHVESQVERLNGIHTTNAKTMWIRQTRNHVRALPITFGVRHRSADLNRDSERLVTLFADQLPFGNDVVELNLLHE